MLPAIKKGKKTHYFASTTGKRSDATFERAVTKCTNKISGSKSLLLFFSLFLLDRTPSMLPHTHNKNRLKVKTSMVKQSMYS